MVETHAVEFTNIEVAKSFVRAIRRRGWEARRLRNRVFVVIGTQDALNLMVKQWARISRRKKTPEYVILE